VDLSYLVWALGLMVLNLALGFVVSASHPYLTLENCSVTAGERSLVGDFVDPQLGYYRGENIWSDSASYNHVRHMCIITLFHLLYTKDDFLLMILMVLLPIGYPVLILRFERGVRFNAPLSSLAKV